MNDSIKLWVSELTEAGWVRYRGMQTVWQAPNGALYRGPYGAWLAMHRITHQYRRLIGSAAK